MVWKPFPLSYLFPSPPAFECTPSDVGARVDGSKSSTTTPPLCADTPSYDYIIIGAGTAGSILANRLSEAGNGTNSVLVLEAGKRVTDFISKIPVFAILRSNDDRYSFKIKTVPQTGLYGKQMEFLAGRVVGGSSAINAGIYTRGPNKELNEWESKHACTGWRADSLEEYFDLPLRHDSHVTPAASIAKGKSGRGPWEYSLRKDHMYAITGQLLDLLDKKGVRRNDKDPYTENQEKGPLGTGCFVLQASISKNGRKIHSGNAYLSDEVLSTRKNLKLCTQAKVVKIDVQKGEDGLVDAKGVFFEDQQKHRYYATAKTRVILCAGVLHTPQVLLLSGIGPKAELERRTIIPMLDSPDIGQHFQDHVAVPLHFLIPYSMSSINVSDGINALPQLIKNLYDYFGRGGQGTFASPGFMEASAWFNTNDLHFSKETISDQEGHQQHALRLECKDPYSRISNIEILFSTYWVEWAQTRYKGLNEDKKNPKGVMGIYVVLTQPKSQGSITLSTDDPHEWPCLNPNYLGDKEGEDLKTLRKGVKFALSVAQDLGQKMGIDISPADIPGWDKVQGHYLQDEIRLQPGSKFADIDQISDEMYDDFIKSHANPIYHGTSTCRMGAEHTAIDPVDLHLRGTSNLHVFDASVFPAVPSTHPQSLVFAGAEKAARSLIGLSH